MPLPVQTPTWSSTGVPTFDTSPFKVEAKREGDTLHLWSVDSDNAMCMKVDASLKGQLDGE